MSLRPFVQFGFAHPGDTANYHKWLFNHFQQPTLVNLHGESLGGWNVAVHPTSLTVQPGITNTIGVSVTVPMSPTNWGDLERVIAVSGAPQPFTATAYIVTIVDRREFSDVPEGSWADGPIQYLANQDIISGYPDGTFRPNNTVTRAQFAKMLVGAMGWTLITPETPRFSDVPQSHWAYAFVETAAAYGVINGYDDGTFHPEAGVTRAQLAKMVSLARGWEMDLPESSDFTDVSVSDWFFSYAEMMRAAEVMGGYDDGTFRPGELATRAQVAKILSLSLFSDPNQ